MPFKPPYASKENFLAQLEQAGLLAPRMQTALEYARRAHKDQKRDQGNPYLEEHIYPIGSGILKRHAADPELENMVILGVLHDVVEDDPNVLLPDIERDFGRVMLDKLLLVTKKPNENTDLLSEEEKRVVNARMLQNLEHASRLAQIVKLEDRLNNLASIERADTPKYLRYVEETRTMFIPFAERVAASYVGLYLEQLARLA